MPKRALNHAAGIVLHVLNRSAKRAQMFFDDEDYRAFETVLAQAVERIPTRLLAYCVMPNHWHLVLWPIGEEIPRLMHWLTLTHARRWHERHASRGTGHVYQNRYRAIPVQGDRHFLTVVRYVERNARRANLVDRAEQWRWTSAWHRCNNCNTVPLSEWPIPQPDDWLDQLNAVHTDSELRAVQTAIRDGTPLGEPEWRAATAALVGLRPRRPGRPRRSQIQTRSEFK